MSKLSTAKYFVSELDWDNSFKDKDNINGYFKMVIEPIRNTDDVHEIKYMRTPKGIVVSGEAYIITGISEKEIDDKIARIERGHRCIRTEVLNEQELW